MCLRVALENFVPIGRREFWRPTRNLSPVNIEAATEEIADFEICRAVGPDLELTLA